MELPQQCVAVECLAIDQMCNRLREDCPPCMYSDGSDFICGEFQDQACPPMEDFTLVDVCGPRIIPGPDTITIVRTEFINSTIPANVSNESVEFSEAVMHPVVLAIGGVLALIILVLAAYMLCRPSRDVPPPDTYKMSTRESSVQLPGKPSKMMRLAPSDVSFADSFYSDASASPLA